MENLTSEQIKRINEVYDSISGEEEYTKEEIIAMYGENAIEFVEGAEDSTTENELSEEISLEDKIEDIWQYYECAGFAIETEKDLFRLLGV